MKSLKILLLLILSVTIYAQSPLGFSFQTIIRDVEGKVQKNQAVKLRFSILQGSESGSSVYSETHAKTTNEYGVINLTVGTGTPVSGSFSSIVWGSNIHFLKTEIDPLGGSSYTIFFTSQLMSVPYAMYASQADTTFKTNVPNGTNTGDILYWNENKWTNLKKGIAGEFLRINNNNELYWANIDGISTNLLPSYVPSNGLVGYWPFNGNANDESGNGNHGTVNGATLTEDRFGKENSAYSFDGIDDYIKTSSENFPNENKSRTISIWFKTNLYPVPDSTFVLFNYGFSYRNQACGIAIDSVIEGGVRINFFSWEESDVINSNNFLLQRWHNVVGTYNGLIGKLFLNGIEIASRESYWNTILQDLFIGKNNQSLNRLAYYFNGQLDDIAIWNRALSEQEILNLYSQNGELLQDIDGNIYKTVKVGNQVWMAENLKTTKFRGGTLIPNVTDNTEWANLSTPAWCNYNNETDNDFIYGKLYNWFTVAGDSLCPTGFHVPTYGDWSNLINYNYLGQELAGNKLKDIGVMYWYTDSGATNELGFTALPAGRRIPEGNFSSINVNGTWWSTTYNGNDYSWNVDIYDWNGGAWLNYNYLKNGFSIRCIKD